MIPIPDRASPLAEVARLFLRLGLTAFGGPAAAIAMMQDEAVTRRCWLDEQQFLDLLSAANLSPGPTATKMAMYLGQRRAGLPGLVTGGVAFMCPAVILMLVFGWAYVEYGKTPAAAWLLYGIKPVIMPLIALALWQIGQRAITGRLTGAVGIGVAALFLLNANPLALMIGGGIAMMVARNARRIRVVVPLLVLGLTVAPQAIAINLAQIFAVFFKIGAVLYGSGYVLIPFLQDDLVRQRGWLTEQQLIDAVAAGQITPGPLSSSATFIGYVLAGVPGALVATVGIFLPAFLIVGLSAPFIGVLRRVAWISALLDGINAAAWGLMAAVTLNLARAAFPDAWAVLIAMTGAGLLLRYKMSSMWLVVWGAGLGLLSSMR